MITEVIMETIHFENEMLILKAEVSKLLSLVMGSYEMSIQSIEDSDERLALRVVQLDDSIDDMNKKVEESVYTIIARFNPIGKSSRYAISMVKFSNNLERIGDLSVNIAQKALEFYRNNVSFIQSSELKEMFGISIQMLRDSFAAFGEKNIDKAIEVWKADTKIDNLERAIDDYIVEHITDNNPDSDIDKSLFPSIILLARDIERIADHATNLCEEIVYIETGKQISELIEE